MRIYKRRAAQAGAQREMAMSWKTNACCIRKVVTRKHVACLDFAGKPFDTS